MQISISAVLFSFVTLISSVAMAAQSPCEYFAHNPELKPERSIDLGKNPDASLETYEAAMVQMTVLSVGLSKPLGADEAKAIFSDNVDGRKGDLGGSIDYFRFEGRTYAKVVYYPGDNEYGLIFSIFKRYASQIGSIEDSDVSCLKFVDLD